ncbi:MAG: VWA domain-containing protein, partial [Phycisphaerales bacterium]|nr:VWA domain-containing protein [Phycisphaerales bacterium]
MGGLPVLVTDLAGGVASVTLGPIQLDRPEWLLLLPVTLGWALWAGRKSLAGLGGASRAVALAVRVVVTLLLVVVLAEPSWRDEAEDVAVTMVLDASRSMPQEAQSRAREWVAQAAARHQRASDRLGTVTAARNAYVQQLPSTYNRQSETTTTIGAADGTNLAEAVQLALAVVPNDAASRLVLFTDANETAGSLLQAAEAARAAGIPIDVVPAEYRYASEVIVDRIVVPATARMGETLNVRVFVEATRTATGRLALLRNGEAVDLDLESPATGLEVTLQPGLNPLAVQVPDPGAGRQEFTAVFEPLVQGGVPVGDNILENNTATGVTFVAGRGRVLVIADAAAEAEHILEVLRRARIEAVLRGPAESFSDLGELSGYDAVVMLNQDTYGFTQGQQEDLRRFVHDVGGGLVMVGGPESFGAGGWIGSPLEDALPVRLDPPQRRQMPRGALALVIHSVEFPNGPHWGKQVCEAAVQALSARDLIGIVEVDWGAAPRWVHRMQPVGDRTAATRAINALQFGDMQDFTPSLRMAYQRLLTVDAGQKHMIIVSDGDPSPPPTSLLQQFRAAQITISTVGLGVHNSGDSQRMALISQATGGNHYDITPGTIATLPQIFVKEAQTVRRSMIWEGTPFAPTVTAAGSEPMRGITSVPAIRGYVISADREGLSMVTMRGGSENDPIAAHWQYGLGKSVAFLSDATSRWGASWVGWDDFQRFWEQHIRWAMRPSGSADVRVATENRGDRTVVTVDA